MNNKQIKALRKSQHELLLALQEQLDEEAHGRLKDHLSSILRLIKDANTTTQERLLAENENLKNRLAENEQQHRAALADVKNKSSRELATGLSAIESKYQKKTAEMEAKVAAFEHINALAGRGMLLLNGVACTTKAINVAKSKFGDRAPRELFFLAVNAAVRSGDDRKAMRLTWGEFDVSTYPTQKGWNVFICCTEELKTGPKVLTVREHEIKRALS